MKKTLLFFGLLAVLFSFNATAQVVCYEEAESAVPDFWVDHFYYAKCTDYVSSGSKVFAGNDDYLDFNGGSTIDFTNIFVPKDGVYTVMLSYGIGYADETGAVVTVNVNGELADQLVLYRLTGAPPAICEFEVELWGDHNNVIQLKQTKDWAITLGIQLVSQGENAIRKVNENSYKISSENGTLRVSNLEGNDNQIRIHSIDSKLLQAVTVKTSSFETSLDSGFYIVSINGKASKVFVK